LLVERDLRELLKALTMRILIISTQALPTPPPYYGGLELVAFTDAVRLAEMGHEVTVIASKHSQASAYLLFPMLQRQIDKVDWYEGIEPNPANLEPQAFQQFLKDRQSSLPSYDVVIDHSWSKQGYTLPNPVVGVIHGLSPYPTGWKPRDKPCLLGVSKFHAEYLSSHLMLTVGVLYDHLPEEPYLAYSTTKDKENMLLFLARLDEGKGLNYFLRLCGELPDYKCVVMGDDWVMVNRNYVRQVYQFARNIPNVEWAGMVPFDLKLEYMRRAKAVFLYPIPPYSEVFGLWALESFLMGTPVITSPFGAMPEYVINGYNGYIIEVKDFLTQAKKIIEDGVPVKATPQELRQFALENFNSRNLVKTLVDYTKKCIKEGW